MESKDLPIIGDATAHEMGQSPAYLRTITQRRVRVLCDHCHKRRYRTMYPGPQPLYCDECRAAVTTLQRERDRDAARERMRRLRAERRACSEAVATPLEH